MIPHGTVAEIHSFLDRCGNLRRVRRVSSRCVLISGNTLKVQVVEARDDRKDRNKLLVG